MKKFLLLTTVLYFLLFVACKAQWGTDVRLTNDTSYSTLSYDWSVAATGNFVHVVWSDERDGNPEIYYKRSTNAGVSWLADTRLTINPGNSSYASVAVSGPVIHVVWEDDRDGNDEIYYKRSTDGGFSWETQTRLTNNSAISIFPSVAVSGPVVHVAWYDDRDGNDEIYYKRSTDGGVNWGTDTRLTNSNGTSHLPSVAVLGSVVHVVWEDDRDGNYEIYYKNSTDGGFSWGTLTRLTNNSASSYHPSVAISGSVVHVVWQEMRDGNAEIYYKRSPDGGVSWGADTRLTNDPGTSSGASVAASGNNVHIAWQDDRDGNWEIYYKSSTDGGANWGTNARLTNNSAISWTPCVAISGSVIHIAWWDDRNGNREIYYKRNPTGNPTGIENINSEIPKDFNLGQNYPNPFNPVTNIKLNVPVRSPVRIILYDMLGKEIRTVIDRELSPGSYLIDLNAVNLPSGVYVYKLTAGDFADSKKMIVLK